MSVVSCSKTAPLSGLYFQSTANFRLGVSLGCRRSQSDHCRCAPNYAETIRPLGAPASVADAPVVSLSEFMSQCGFFRRSVRACRILRIDESRHRRAQSASPARSSSEVFHRRLKQSRRLAPSSLHRSPGQYLLVGFGLDSIVGVTSGRRCSGGCTMTGTSRRREDHLEATGHARRRLRTSSRFYSGSPEMWSSGFQVLRPAIFRTNLNPAGIR